MNKPPTFPEIWGIGLGIAFLAAAFSTAGWVLRHCLIGIFRDIRGWWQRRRAALKPWRPSAHSLAVWAGRPARWWQFWLPDSGVAGGMVAGILALILFAIVNLVLRHL